MSYFLSITDDFFYNNISSEKEQKRFLFNNVHITIDSSISNPSSKSIKIKNVTPPIFVYSDPL